MAIVIQFTVGDPGYPTANSVSYRYTALAGKKVKVFRDGLYQYNQKGENFIINSNSGTIFFSPAFIPGERIRIQTVDNANLS